MVGLLGTGRMDVGLMWAITHSKLPSGMGEDEKCMHLLGAKIKTRSRKCPS